MVGETVSHYVIREKLGEGGMGVVYRAEDTRLQRTVALKFLPPELTRDEDAKQRFVQEARAASALDHPNICTIHDIDETDDGRLFISMTCYEGETLEKCIGRGPLDFAAIAELGIGIASGLSKAHGRGIVHRDIKPGNVFITQDGRAKILDFGLATLAGQSRLTREGTTVGTVSYMSPEQARGRRVDHRTDVWSLGVTLYEMVTGRRPFIAENQQAALYTIIHETPEPATALRDDVPPLLQTIIERCLQKDPEARYPTVAELCDDLVRLKPETGLGPVGIMSAPTVTVERSRRQVVRLIAPVAALVVAVVALSLPPVRGFLRDWVAGRRLPDERYLAIVPFGGGDTAGERAFREGLAEYLALRLSQVEPSDDHFRVLPMGDVRAAGVNEVDDAASLVGATVALAGDVGWDGELARLDLELVNTSSGRTVRRLPRDVNIGNVSTLQDGIVLEVADKLGMTVEPEMRRALTAGGTTVPAAFISYLTGLGLLWSEEGDREENIKGAIVRFDEALSGDPGYVLALAALGRAHRELCQATTNPECNVDAVEACVHAIELGNQLASPHVTLGDIATARGNDDEAAREYEKALEIAPLDLAARSGLAGAYLALDRPVQAEHEYERVIRDRPGYWGGYYELGLFYETRGKYKEAAEQLELVTGLAPGNSMGYAALGAIYYYDELYEDALEALTKANQLEPSYDGYSNLGTFSFHQGHYADAVVMFEQACEIDSSDYRLWGNLASAYGCVPGGSERSMEAYREAIARAESIRAIAPRDPMLPCLLAQYHAKLDNDDVARALTEEALELDPGDPEILFHAGINYEILDDREEALRCIAEALERDYSREQIERTPELRGLCTDPRYQELVRSREIAS